MSYRNNIKHKIRPNSEEYQQQVMPCIEHELEKVNVKQRVHDGYINATALCKASNKKLNDYLRLVSTRNFIRELKSVTGISVTDLIQIIQGGIPIAQGTWVHPQVAINLAQWASPKFAVFVSKWVVDWMTGKGKNMYEMPYHIRRYIVNRSKIPPTHFSMLNEMTLRLVAPLEQYNYLLPVNLMPDISMGKMFSNWCREHGYDPDSFPTYEHVFDDGKRPPVQARLYPNELLTKFRLYFDNEWMRKRAVKYFADKDEKVVPYLKAVIEELPQVC